MSQTDTLSSTEMRIGLGIECIRWLHLTRRTAGGLAVVVVLGDGWINV
jgi:hypothetical protein